MKRKVFLAIPCLQKRFCDQTEMAIQLLAMECAGLGYEFEQFRWCGDSIVAHARNVCMAKFFKSDATDLFFLDSDVACGPGVFSRILNHRVDFVAGIYRTKTEPEKYAVRWAVEPGEKLYPDEKTGLLAANGVPFGFVRITREAINAMVKFYADLWFMSHIERKLKCWALFDNTLVNHEFEGEDFAFCRRWREMGGKVWVDPELPLVHVANDGTRYHGHLGEFLRKTLED
jgi:hypothetical protein